jgi:hypothetical protein
MSRHCRILFASLCSLLAACSTAEQKPEAVEAGVPAGLTEKGTPDIRIGQAASDTGSMSCRMAAWDSAPPGVHVMLEKNVVVRIDVDSGSMATSEGVAVGDPESKVMSLYAGRVAVTPHKYVPGGHYLTVHPADPADSLYRLVFETDGKNVTQFRAGQRPQVEYVERCG